MSGGLGGLCASVGRRPEQTMETSSTWEKQADGVDASVGPLFSSGVKKRKAVVIHRLLSSDDGIAALTLYVLSFATNTFLYNLFAPSVYPVSVNRAPAADIQPRGTKGPFQSRSVAVLSRISSSLPSPHG